MYASNSHSYTHLILALGIVREPTIWVFITSKYPDIRDIGLATTTTSVLEIECNQDSKMLGVVLSHGSPRVGCARSRCCAAPARVPITVNALASMFARNTLK